MHLADSMQAAIALTGSAETFSNRAATMDRAGVQRVAAAAW